MWWLIALYGLGWVLAVAYGVHNIIVSISGIVNFGKVNTYVSTAQALLMSLGVAIVLTIHFYARYLM